MNLDDLHRHAFSVEVLREAMSFQKPPDEKGAVGELEELDEYQYYISTAGYSLSQLLTWIEQLDHAVVYLTNYSYGKKSQNQGVNRAKHLLYNVENYLIRLQSIYDRALQLTNNVFHLCIEESNVGHSVIISNLKVARTDVKAQLKSLKKEVEKKSQERHAIVHRKSHQEENLRRLEMMYHFDKKSWEDSDVSISFDGLAHIRSQLMRSVVAEKTEEFSEINQAVAEKVCMLLDGLHRQYTVERERLRIYVYSETA